MDIGGAALHRIGKDAVDEANDRCIVDLRPQLFRRDLFLLLFDELDFQLLELVQKFAQFGRRDVVVLFDQRAKGDLARHQQLDVEAGDELQNVHQSRVGGIGEGDRERSTAPLDRQQGVFAGEIGGDHRHGALIHLHLREIDGGKMVLAGDHRGDVRFR